MQFDNTKHSLVQEITKMATGKKAATLAGKGLRKKNTSKAQKTIDASDLAQVRRPSKDKRKKK